MVWEAAGWFWSVNYDINSTIENADDAVLGVTQKVNGGKRRLEERRTAYEKAILLFK